MLNDKNEKISFWNDVPLRPQGSKEDIINIGIEIPRTNIAKMEVCKTEDFHPIK